MTADPPPAFRPGTALLSERRAADLLGIDRQTLRRAALDGLVAHFVDPRGRRGYDPSILRSFWRAVPPNSTPSANFTAPVTVDPES